jgi:hypothetical protein
MTNVYGQLTANGVDVPPGQTDYWQTSGLDGAQAAWYVAIPLSFPGGPPGDKVFEVQHTQFECDVNGNRLVFTQVTNVGSAVASYSLYILWTDPL